MYIYIVLHTEALVSGQAKCSGGEGYCLSEASMVTPFVALATYMCRHERKGGGSSTVCSAAIKLIPHATP